LWLNALAKIFQFDMADREPLFPTPLSIGPDNSPGVVDIQFFQNDGDVVPADPTDISCHFPTSEDGMPRRGGP
jgi:hypothetical protein